MKIHEKYITNEVHTYGGSSNSNAKSYITDPKVIKELEMMVKKLKQMEKKLDSPDMIRDIQGAYYELESLVFRMKRGN